MSNIYHIYAQRGQSLFDIAMQEFGNIDYIYTLLQDNALTDITTIFQESTKLLIRVKSDIKPELVEYARAVNKVNRFIYDNSKPQIADVWNDLEISAKKAFINSLSDDELESIISFQKRNKLNYILPVGNSLLSSYADGDPNSLRWDSSRHKLYTLETNNRFGNKSRFTDLNGAAKTQWNSSQYLIDHAQGVLLCKKNNTQAFDSLNWDDSMAYAVNFSGLDFTDWLIPDDKYWLSLVYRGNNFSSSARLFWLNIESTSNNFWTSITDGYSTTSQACYIAGVAANINVDYKTSTMKFILYRKIKDIDNLF